MARLGPHTFDANPQPMPADPSKKPSIDKLIDINHYLMRRVEELEEHIKLQMESNIRDQMTKQTRRPSDRR